MTRPRATPWQARDGTRYLVATGGTGPAVLLLHGFAGRGTEWAPFLAALHEVATTVRVDLLGHGGSEAPVDPGRHALDRQAADIAWILAQRGLMPVAVVGYSFGARVALQLALDAPEVVGSLFLESPSGGIADPEARSARRAADAQLAALLEHDGIAAFTAHWESLPLFASERALPPAVRARIRRTRLANDAGGLAGSLRGAGQGTMEPLFVRLDSLSVPTTVVGGALDLVGRERVEAVAAAIPGARCTILPGVGHAPHREDPATFLALLLDHLARSAAGAATLPTDHIRRVVS